MGSQSLMKLNLEITYLKTLYYAFPQNVCSPALSFVRLKPVLNLKFVLPHIYSYIWERIRTSSSISYIWDRIR